MAAQQILGSRHADTGHMTQPIHPDHEARRLKALRDLYLLDTPPEQVLDDLTTLAAHLCETPIALITLIDEERGWFKSKLGLDATELQRATSFCTHTTMQPDLMVVPDATRDERFVNSPLVTGEPHIRFYAGAPLITPDGYALGTLCVIDRVPRTLTPMQQEALRVLSKQVMAQLELRRQAHELAGTNQTLRFALESARLGDWDLDLITDTAHRSLRHDQCFGYTAPVAEWGFDKFIAHVHPEDRARVELDFRAATTNLTPWDFECRVVWPDSSTHWISSHGDVYLKEGKPVRMLGLVTDITARKQADEALHKSEALLRIAGRAARLGGWTLDLSEQKLTWSDETFRIHDLPPGPTPTLEEAIHFYPPEYRDEVTRHVQLCVTEGIPFDFELELITAKQRRIRVKAIGEALRDAGGRIVRVQGAFQDITEQKAAEETARSSAERLAQTLESITDSFFTLDREWRFTYVNAEAERVLNCLRTTLLGRSIWEVYPETVGSTFEREYRRALATHATVAFEEYYPPLGIWFEVKAHPTAEGLAVYFRDVTARHRTVEALRVSGERFRLLAGATNDAIWDWDLITDQLSWNEGYETMFGHARAEVDPTIKSWTDYIHPEDLARVTEGIYRVIEHDGESWSDEYRFRCQDGRYAHVLDRGHIIRDAAGKPVRMIGGMTDLTTLKEHEIALSRSNRALQLLSRSNEALIRSESESGLLAAICQIAVDVGGFRLAWVGYALDDADKTIESQSHAGVEDGYLSTMRLTWGDSSPVGQGPAARVIRHGKPVVIPDIELDEGCRPWLEKARARGFRGVIALPLADNRRTYGVLVLYLPEVRHPLPDEMRLLQELADDLAFGIVNIRTRLDRERMHSAVEQIATAVAAATSKDFFEQLARNMAIAVGAQAGFVAKVVPGKPIISRTLAAVVDNQVTANFDYVIEGTPCESFFTSHTCVIHNQVSQQFPASPSLAALGAQGFVGRRLDSSTGKFIGQLFVIFREPLKEADFAVSTLQIFAARAAAELEREETDAQVREQAALLDKAQDAIIVRDLDHHITYWNSSAGRLYGWTAEEAVGRSSRELLYRDAGAFDLATAQVRARGEWIGKIDQCTKAGDNISVEGRWTLVRDDQGHPKSILAINTDITERKKLEKQFLRSQRLESIGTLAGGIAHDLNNALAPIMMGIELLREDYPKESPTLDLFESSAQRSADMVRQLLSFAKGAEGNHIVLQPAHLVRDLEKMMKGSFPKNIRVEVNCDANLPTVLGDATQLNQVLLNLCVNARDAMANGGTLTLEAQPVTVDAVFASSIPDATPGDYVLLRVRDTGTGIAPDVLDRIFDPFFTTKTPDKGTGLGLSTVMGIVKGHDGFLQVYSQPGQGSMFAAYLPAASSEAGVEQATTAPATFRGQGELIVFVDDEVVVRQVASAVLTRLNFKVVTATNGVDGLVKLAEHRTDVRAVITDLHMPNMDGLLFVRSLRNILPNVPVLVASGRLDDAVDAEFKALGVTNRLDKPFTERQLAEALKRLLASG